MIKKTNLFFSTLLLIFLSFNIYTQETEAKQEIEQKTEETNKADQTEVLTKVPSDFGFYFGTEIILSSLKKRVSQPFSTALNFGAEYEYKGIKYFSIVPSLDFSIFYYSLLNQKAYICEIENRTGLAMSFLLDTPFMARFDIKSCTISIGGGLAFFIRYALLAPGINPSASGSGGLSTAAELKEINKYFWQKGRFFYPSLRFKTEYTFTSGWKTGLQIKTFFPLSNAWDNTACKWTDGLIIQAGVVLHPPVKKTITRHQ